MLAPKKDGEWRYCINYRELNSKTRKDAFPLPRIDDALEALSSPRAKIFSTLDIASEYWRIPISDRDKVKTGFMGRTG